jgi:PAS domain S-box-containing protein
MAHNSPCGDNRCAGEGRNSHVDLIGEDTPFMTNRLAGRHSMPRGPNREAIVERLSYSPDLAFAQQPALQQIYDTAPIGLACLSPDCRYLQINQHLTEICGISVADHIGRSVRDCVPALADSVEQIVRSIMETGEPVTGIEVAGQRPDQTVERSWITYWHPLRDLDGDIVAINVAAEEITARKRHEQEIRSAKEAAETALQNLRETQQSLIESEKLAALGRLVAGVAHEINNPIGVSLTVASSLEWKRKVFAEKIAAGDLKQSSLSEFIEDTREACSQLMASLNRAAELIQAFKQVAADRSQSDQRIFDSGDLTRQVLMSLRAGSRKRNLKLNVECQSNVTMNSYPGPYGQVLTNLFLNSVMHAFPDGEEGSVDIKVRAFGEDEVEILFSDDGCGMSYGVKRQAFNPFFTTRRAEGCTGLGLHVVHNIVTNRLGGRISLESEPGEGTKIQLIVPRMAPTERVDAAV